MHLDRATNLLKIKAAMARWCHVSLRFHSSFFPYGISRCNGCFILFSERFRTSRTSSGAGIVRQYRYARWTKHSSPCYYRTYGVPRNPRGIKSGKSKIEKVALPLYWPFYYLLCIKLDAHKEEREFLFPLPHPPLSFPFPSRTSLYLLYISLVI